MIKIVKLVNGVLPVKKSFFWQGVGGVVCFSVVWIHKHLILDELSGLA